MIIILLVAFDVRWRLLPLGVVLVGVVWAFGMAGYLGIPLTVVTIAGLPVMLGVGIDYAIQMHARIEEEVVIDSEVHPIQESARALGPALLVVTFDAIFAFAALRFAKVPMIRDFGLLLAVGHRDDLPVQHRRARWPRWASASSSRRRSARTSARAPSAGVVLRLGSLPSKIAPFLIVGERRRLRRRVERGGRARPPDRPDRVGQPGLAGHRGPRPAPGRDAVVQRARGVRGERPRLHRRDGGVRRRLRQASSSPTTPRSCSRRRASSPRSAS